MIVGDRNFDDATLSDQFNDPLISAVVAGASLAPLSNLFSRKVAEIQQQVVETVDASDGILGVDTLQLVT